MTKRLLAFALPALALYLALIFLTSADARPSCGSKQYGFCKPTATAPTRTPTPSAGCAGDTIIEPEEQRFYDMTNRYRTTGELPEGSPAPPWTPVPHTPVSALTVKRSLVQSSDMKAKLFLQRHAVTHDFTGEYINGCAGYLVRWGEAAATNGCRAENVFWVFYLSPPHGAMLYEFSNWRYIGADGEYDPDFDPPQGACHWAVHVAEN